ncbi:MAG TPA: hypothetical protein VK024_09405 [Actinomycetaceae bacterium]|nr:hypothetical protein [Actinomycetaceae bacterium]
MTIRKLPALAGAALLALGLAACGDDGGDGPDAAAVAFFSALNDGECDDAAQYVHLTDLDFGEVCPLLAAQFEGEDLNPTVDDVSEDGDTATVTMTHDGSTDEIPMVQVDGDWKVDLDFM